MQHARIAGWHVIAGKIDSYGENVQHANYYTDLDEALADYDRCLGYHFRRIEAEVKHNEEIET